MTEPIDQATKDRIAWIADTSSSTPWESQRMKIFGERIAKEIATVWAEKLKQERNKVIDECIDVIFDKMIEVGPNKRFSYKECKTILQSIKDQIHEPEAKTKDSQKPY